jgi:hypothetical protein
MSRHAKQQIRENTGRRQGRHVRPAIEFLFPPRIIGRRRSPGSHRAVSVSVVFACLAKKGRGSYKGINTIVQYSRGKSFKCFPEFRNATILVVVHQEWQAPRLRIIYDNNKAPTNNNNNNNNNNMGIIYVRDCEQQQQQQQNNSNTLLHSFISSVSQ